MSYLVTPNVSMPSVSQWGQFSFPKQIPGLNEPQENVMNGIHFPVSFLEPVIKRQSWQDIGTSTVHVHQSMIPLLERFYTFRERSNVLGFLDRYPFLVPLLLEAYGKIGEYFPCSRIFLEVVTDPDAVGDSQLLVFIATDFDPDEADDKFERFDEDWWLDALDLTQGMLCINLEFQ